MARITEDDLKKTIVGLGEKFQNELFGKTQEELEEYWFFKYNAEQSLEDNLCEFHDKLTLYASFCHSWEEHHGGICCVVGRVERQYIRPKVQAFIRAYDSQLAEAMEVLDSPPLPTTQGD